MNIRFFDFDMYHGKRDTGSVKIRVDNLLKYWPEAKRYQYGENPDVLIFQKVYVTQDYRFPIEFKGIKILDICDPDWLSGATIKETVDAMDAIVAPTKPIVDFVKQLTDKPVILIKDRFDLSTFGEPKEHSGPVEQVVWFGYSHNAELLKSAMPLLKRLNIKLLVISNNDPHCWQWTTPIEEDALHYKPLYTFKGYANETIHNHIKRADVCILPKGYRPQDVFKSENKTIIANLCGLPVAFHDDDLERLNDPKVRAKEAKQAHEKAIKEYDCKLSVEEYKNLISKLSTSS